MNNNIKRFLKLLKKATSGVDNTYFTLPISGLDIPIYRERVYAYELYHQLRTIWPQNWDFVLNGEVDKRGHPLIEDPSIIDAKPDLLVHRPGCRYGNLVIVEIKPVTASVNYIKQDLCKLNAFCNVAKYTLGVLLFFGTQVSADVIRKRCLDASLSSDVDIKRENISIYLQDMASCSAKDIGWVEVAT